MTIHHKLDPSHEDKEGSTTQGGGDLPPPTCHKSMLKGINTFQLLFLFLTHKVEIQIERKKFSKSVKLPFVLLSSEIPLGPGKNFFKKTLTVHISIQKARWYSTFWINEDNNVPRWTRVNLNLNRTDPLMTCVKYRPDPIICLLSFNFDGAAGLFTVPDLSQAYSTIAQFSVVPLHQISLDSRGSRSASPASLSS